MIDTPLLYTVWELFKISPHHIRLAILQYYDKVDTFKFESEESKNKALEFVKEFNRLVMEEFGDLYS